jgi:very-short-patch-repair endonuclease
MKKQTQKEKVREILLRDGKIDNFFCLDTRLTIRLSGIIHLLRQEGMNIRTEELESKNCIYHLVKETV